MGVLGGVLEGVLERGVELVEVGVLGGVLKGGYILEGVY